MEAGVSAGNVSQIAGRLASGRGTDPDILSLRGRGARNCRFNGLRRRSHFLEPSNWTRHQRACHPLPGCGWCIRNWRGKPDADGELRELDLDAVVELDIKIYEEEPLELVEDLYATDRGNRCGQRRNQFDKILTNTTGKCKINRPDEIRSHRPGSSVICHHDGQIKVDQVEVKEDGLEISGVLEVIFYI